MKKENSSVCLRNPNDPSHEGCFAPVENGHVNVSKKKHIKAGEDPPNGWVEVKCSADCLR